jgi:hypothetical protein
MKKNILLLLTLVSILSGFSQTKIVAPRLYSETLLNQKRDSLLLLYGNNKTFLSSYEVASLIALRHYPQLVNTKIIFKEKSINSTMQARPKGLNILRRKGKRKYVVYINTINPKVPLDSISFNAKVGVLGHELAHIVDYESRSVLSILGIALRYGSKKYRAKFERATDQMTINHGLLWQSYDFSAYVFKYNQGNTKYLEYKKKVYMTPEEHLLQADSTMR